MNKVSYLLLSTILFSSLHMNAFKYGEGKAEKHGRTFNVGAGIGYVNDANQLAPTLQLNYEFDLVRNITLAPFVGICSYSDIYYWGNTTNPYKDYRYRETVIPFGIKGAYYFDELTHLNPKWDLYSAFSIGLVIHTVSWEANYYGDRNVATRQDNVYVQGHIGARYHINKHNGIFLDLSTGGVLFGGSYTF